jgi:hypothetical protein
LLLVNGQVTGAEQKLQAAEAALQGAEPDQREQGVSSDVFLSSAGILSLHLMRNSQMETRTWCC